MVPPVICPSFFQLELPYNNMRIESLAVFFAANFEEMKLLNSYIAGDMRVSLHHFVSSGAVKWRERKKKTTKKKST